MAENECNLCKGMDDEEKMEFDESNDEIQDGEIEEKIEVCYTCGKEFDMNRDKGAHYHYGKYPMCGYCTNFFGFYQEDLMDK